jgi:hypothetical protein
MASVRSIRRLPSRCKYIRVFVVLSNHAKEKSLLFDPKQVMWFRLFLFGIGKFVWFSVVAFLSEKKPIWLPPFSSNQKESTTNHWFPFKSEQR